MLGAVGRRFSRWQRDAVGIAALPYAAAKGAVVERGRGAGLVARSTASQIYFTAVEPLPILGVIAVVCGFSVISISDALMRPNGLAPHVPVVVAQAIVREILPIVIALVLIGRSGTAIATELGYMRVNEEIDALDAAGVNIDYFLVLPRIIGVTVSTLSLTIALSFVAIFGGFMLGEALNLVSVGLRFDAIIDAVSLSTIGFATLKGAAFGLVISTVNCFHGLAVGRSFTEIPRANVRGTVACYLVCLALNAALSVYALAERAT